MAKELPNEKLFTTVEVAKMLNVAQETVRNWIYEDKLKAIRVGNTYRISEGELKHFLEEANENGK